MRNGANLRERQKFSGTQDHYTGLAAGKMEKIEILTLMMHSEDDPIVGYASVDWKSVKMNKYVVSATTKRGGHVQWHDGILPFGSTWCHQVATDFIASVLEIHATTNFMIDVVVRARGDEQLSTLPPSSLARIVSGSDIRGNEF